MNYVSLSGRLTSDPQVYEKATKFTLAVDRRFKRDGEPTADFISCVAFGKTAEFVGKYLKQGTKIIAEGRIQTGFYEKNGQKIYTTDVVAESVEFAESKKTVEKPKEEPKEDANGFVNIPDSLKDEGLPF